jgi:ABC-type uncharacterized transport system involved in gliding motility auxiliary subunit
MEITQRSRRQLRLHTLVFVILFLAVIGLLAAASILYKVEFDWTATGRHTLSAASIKVLQRMPDAINITAYASGGDQAPEHQRIRALLKRYQKHKANIELKFVDPLTNPDKVRELGIQIEGEMIVQYGNRSEHVKSFDEASLTNSLQRLLRVGERKIVFISGHGERSPQGRANHDYGSFLQNLAGKGIASKTLNLAQERAIPADTAVLVIAGPEMSYLDGEIQLIKTYLDTGGNLLWLHDPLGKADLSGLAKALGIQFPSGIILDLDVRLLGVNDPSVVMATEYPAQAITQNFTFLTLFPRVAAIEVNKAAPWQYTDFLRSVPNSWLEKGNLKTAVKFDPGVDVHGPITFGVAGMREIKAKDAPPKDAPDTSKPPKMQRVVVIGDGDFLSNAFLGNQGNQQLGENIINWLAQDDNFIDIPPTTAPGTKLTLSETSWALLGGFFFLVLPGLLIGIGLFIWLRRRKR